MRAGRFYDILIFLEVVIGPFGAKGDGHRLFTTVTEEPTMAPIETCGQRALVSSRSTVAFIASLPTEARTSVHVKADDATLDRP